MIKIDRAELIVFDLPIKHPFTVSFGTITNRNAILVKLYSNGVVGYWECASFHFPLYLPDFTAAEYLVLEKFILPAILWKSFSSPEEFVASYQFVKWHNFAKTAVECAFWHILAQQKNTSLTSLFWWTRTEIEAWESLWIKSSIQETIDEVQQRIDEWYKRIKVKIKRWRDVSVAEAIRSKFPSISLMLDGNSDYTLEDKETLLSLDRFDLLMLEQPLWYDDIVDHSFLQKDMKTPICLDESILSCSDTRKSLAIWAAKIINIKPWRVWWPLESIKIHDYCQKHGIGVWCWGMLETWIGRAFNIALASLPNFIYPADMSETLLFYNEDFVKNPYKIVDWMIDVPQTPWLWYEIDDVAIAKYTIHSQIYA